MQSVGIDPMDIFQKEAINIVIDWLKRDYPDITKKAFKVHWFAYLPTGWKCMLELKPCPGYFYEITKNVKTGEIIGGQYRQTAYFVKPSSDEPIPALVP